MSSDGYTYELICHEGVRDGDITYLTYERRLELLDATEAEAREEILELQKRPDVIRVALRRRLPVPQWETIHSGPGPLMKPLAP